MKKKLFLWLFVSVGLFMLVYGCHNIATEMSDGEKLYLAKCSSCHNVIAPSCYDKGEWRLHIDEYGGKMTVEEKQAVLQYLTDSE